MQELNPLSFKIKSHLINNNNTDYSIYAMFPSEKTTTKEIKEASIKLGC